MSVLFAVTLLTTVVLLNTLHAPANVDTQRQATSLDDIERIETQVSDDLERLFLVHTSMNRTGEALPYAEENGGPDDSFGDVVRNYSELNDDLIASESGAAVRVNYSEDRSQKGALVRQNDSTQDFTYDGYPSSTQSWTVLGDADGLPRFSMNVTEEPADSDSPFKVVVEDGNQLNFTGDGVTFYEPGPERREDCELEYPIQVDATNGVGAVSNQTRGCGTFDLEPTDNFDLTFENGSQVTGTYTVSGVEVSDSDLDGNTYDWQQFRDGVVVKPAFRVQYTDSTVRHSANFTLYNETTS